MGSAVTGPGPAEASGAHLLWAAIYLGLLAATVLLILPLLIGSLTSEFDLSGPQIGVFASIDLFAMGCGGLVTRFAVRRAGPARVALAATLMLIAGNVVSAHVPTFGALLATRAVTSLFGGVGLGLAYLTFARQASVDRAMALFVLVQTSFGALVFFAAAWLGGVGSAQLFYALAATAVPALFSARAFRGASWHSEDEPRSRVALSRPTALGLAGVFLFFASQGALWAYADYFGRTAGLAAVQLSTSFAICTIASVLGPLMAAFAPPRTLPALTAVGYLASLLSFWMIASPSSVLWFALGASIFNVAWNLLVARTSAIVALVDDSRSTTALLASASAFGLAAGPALGAIVFRISDYMVVYASALVLMASAALLMATERSRRQLAVQAACGRLRAP